MNKGISYNQFYNILLNLREEFHRSGRIDDSNAKLDEVLKILITSYSLARRGIIFNIEYVRDFSQNKYGNQNKIARSIKDIFSIESKNDIFINNDGSNIFGSKATLSLDNNDDSFAELLISEISKIDFNSLLNVKNENNFDIINECFGHFVRDNFRNNKEDGQYMTPAEVSKPISKIIVQDIFNDKNSIEDLEKMEFKILDPTCGVGTLAIELENEIINYYKCDELKTKFKKECVFAQDKVERMVRMSKINFMLLNNNISNAFIGNSIIGDSKIDELKGKINVIISNPPFGADFELNELDLTKYPFINSLNGKYKKIKSEILILDKSLDLLKKGGYLAIVLPDGVFSSKGIFADLRNYLLENYQIKWIIDLPSVAFAQAGTRTNTAILFLKKEAPKNKNQKIKMVVCDDIGYDVKERMGVPVKIEKGKNELIEIVNKINEKKDGIISIKPSIVSIKYNQLLNNILKPNFYSSTRMKIVNDEVMDEENSELVKLESIVTTETKNRKSYFSDDSIKHVSILHIDDDGVINFKEVESFSPISKGREIFEGDILF